MGGSHFDWDSNWGRQSALRRAATAICRSASASARRTRAVEQRALGINQLRGQRQLLPEPGAGQADTFRSLGDRLLGHAEALVGGFEVEAGLFDLEVERQPQLALFFTSRFEVSISLRTLARLSLPSQRSHWSSAPTVKLPPPCS